MKIKNFVVVILILGLAVALFASCKGKHGKRGPAKEIEVVKIIKGDIERKVLFTGDIVANAAFDVFPRATGKVSKKVLKEGDPVKRNQPILLVERDEVGYRFKEMPVVSLVDGFVGTIAVDAGADVSPLTPVATVVQPGNMRVKLDVPERYLGVIAPGTEIEMAVDTMGDAKFMGVISTTSPVVSEKTRTANVEIVLQDDGGKLRHGMFGRINLVVEKHEGVFIAPIEAISWEGDKRFVYKVAGGKIARTEVNTGLRNDINVEILDNVAEGETIAVGNLLNLRDGEEVAVKE